ncbi:MAG: hypothetical protein QXT45_06135 [Candidatus Bilamarchaeaceae archaeon]
MSRRSYIVNNQPSVEMSDIARANQFFHLDEVHLVNSLFFMVMIRYSHHQDFLDAIFGSFVDVQGRPDDKALERLVVYRAYTLLVDLGQAFRARGNLYCAPLCGNSLANKAE